MAYRNKIIRNPKTRMDVRFLNTATDTHGQLLEMEATYNAHSNEPVAHYHPFQEEDFTVQEGALMVRMDGTLKVLRKGETLHVPRNTVHSMWNNSDQVTVVNWKVQPALDTEYFLETATGLANDGKTNENGSPSLLQVALMASKYSHIFRLAKPPFALQKVLFIILTPFAFAFGYRPSYRKYLD